MAILEKLPDDPQREIEMLREVIKAKDALIEELRKRPFALPPVYMPYPVHPAWPYTHWTCATTTTSATTGSINIKGDISGKSWTVVS